MAAVQLLAIPLKTKKDGAMGLDLSKNIKGQSDLIQTEDGFAYRDLNKNGRLDIYEDPRQPIDARIEDLLQQMTLPGPAETVCQKHGFIYSRAVRTSCR